MCKLIHCQIMGIIYQYGARQSEEVVPNVLTRGIGNCNWVDVDVPSTARDESELV